MIGVIELNGDLLDTIHKITGMDPEEIKKSLRHREEAESVMTDALKAWEDSLSEEDRKDYSEILACICTACIETMAKAVVKLCVMPLDEEDPNSDMLCNLAKMRGTTNALKKAFGDLVDSRVKQLNREGVHLLIPGRSQEGDEDEPEDEPNASSPESTEGKSAEAA